MSMFKAFNSHSMPEAVQRNHPLVSERAAILQVLLNTITSFGVLGLILIIIRTPFNNNNLPLYIPVVLFIVIQFVITAARRLPYYLRAAALVLFIAVMSLISLLQEGLSGTWLIYAIALVTATTVLFGYRASIFSIVGVAVTHGIIGWLLITGRIFLPINLPWMVFPVNSGAIFVLIDALLAVLLCTISIVSVVNQLTRGLSSAFEAQKNLSVELGKAQQLFDHHVQERTQEFSQKTSLLEAARQASNRIAAAVDTPDLLDTAAEAIREYFDFYQVNIFLNDEHSEYSTLRAATGEIGQKLLESNLRMKIGDTGIVGYVAGKGKPRIAREFEGDPNTISNPSLPETRAELAVPLVVGGNIAGVLDIQSSQINAFLVDEVDILTGLAGRISQSLEYTRQLEDLRQSLRELENTNLQNTKTAWNIHMRSSKRGFAFRYRQAIIEKKSSQSPELLQALKQGATIVTSAPTNSQSTQPFATLAIPIKIRNQTLGVINMRVAGGRVSPELIELVEGAVNCLSASLENARLLEDIQARSERERLVGDIGSRVRSATDIDSILRTAAGELGRSLGVSEVVI